ncbi:MAG: MJ0042-type zinc finger domain-containing protein [Sphingomicrobium sp.]
MILTCPACDTKYVVKDGAIPPAGRQVRCASCKHSWHQDASLVAAGAEAEQPIEIASLGGPPEPMVDDHAEFEAIAEIPAEAEAEQMIAEAPEPEVAAPEYDEREARIGTPAWDAAAIDPGNELAPDMAAAVEPDVQSHEPPPTEEEGEFVGYVERYADEDDRPRRRWPVLLLILFLIAVAAAAFWFLAPPEWKARAGIAQAGSSPLQLMITTSDRQPLESGNELVAISGRVFNPTDVDQNVPPIRAELRNKRSKALIHQWTIAPPTRVLAPRSSASFNSAEVDVPEGGDELTVTLGV